MTSTTRSWLVLLAIAATSCLSKPAPPIEDCELTAMSGQGDAACVVRSDGELWCWGSKDNVGDGTGVERPAPVRALLDDPAAAVSVGEFHGCAVAIGGQVYCWGPNDHGQVGDGTAIRRDRPTRAGVDDAAAVATGQSHSCARLDGGAASCWGGNTYGALGDGSMTDRAVPGAVRGLTMPVTQIAVGDFVTCAVLADGTAACWGDGSHGALGDGTYETRLMPSPVWGLVGVTQVSAGCHLHACAVAGGDVYCWGNNERGQLGDGTMTDNPFPVLADITEPIVEVSVGAWHTCARGETGTVYCWGSNDFGQLGFDTSGADSVVPAYLPMFADGGVTSIQAGCGHACAVRAGQVWCWGADYAGQLGDGPSTQAMRLAPALTAPICPTAN